MTLCAKRLNVEVLRPDVEKVYWNIDKGISMYEKIKELFGRCKYLSDIFCFTDVWYFG